MGYGTGFLGGAGSGAGIGSAFGPVGTGVGAGLGGIFGLVGADEEKKRAEKQNQVEVAKAITNPWLHMEPGKVDQPGGVGAALGMAGAGIAQGQNIRAADANDAFQKKLLAQGDRRLDIQAAQAGQSPWLAQGASGWGARLPEGGM